MMAERLTVRVQVGGTTESGLSLHAEDGSSYHWVTRAHTSPLFYANRNEWFKVTLTSSVDSWGRRVAKNVRVIRD